jgi:hypothetical protein
MAVEDMGNLPSSHPLFGKLWMNSAGRRGSLSKTSASSTDSEETQDGAVSPLHLNPMSARRDSQETPDSEKGQPTQE